MIKKIIFLFFSISLIKSKQDNNQNNNIINLQKEIIQNELEEEKKINKFFENTKINFFGKKYLCSFNNKIFYIYNLETKVFEKIKLSIKETDKNECFYYDGSFIYIINNNKLKKFDKSGKQVKESENLGEFCVKKIDTNNSLIYIFSLKNEIYCLNQELNCLWMNNDFILELNPFEFFYDFYEDYLILFSKNRLSFLNKLNGNIIKNFYTDFSYSGFLFENNQIFLYDNLRYNTITFQKKEKEILINQKEKINFRLQEEEYKIIGNKIIIKEKQIEAYPKVKFVKNCLILYYNNDLSTKLVKISEDKIIKKEIKNFILKEIYEYKGTIILIDEGKFKFI